MSDVFYVYFWMDVLKWIKYKINDLLSLAIVAHEVLISQSSSVCNKILTHIEQSGTLPFSVALRELAYTVTPFDRATENGIYSKILC